MFGPLSIDEAKEKLSEINAKIHSLQKSLEEIEKTSTSSQQTTSFNSILEQEKVQHEIETGQQEINSLESKKEELTFLIELDNSKHENIGYRQAFEIVNNPTLHEAIQEYWKTFRKPEYEEVPKKKRFLLGQEYERVEKDVPFNLKIKERSLASMLSRFSVGLIPPDIWEFSLSVFMGEYHYVGNTYQGQDVVPTNFEVKVIWRSQETKRNIGGIYTAHDKWEVRNGGISIEIPQTRDNEVFYSLDNFCSFLARCIVQKKKMH